MTLYFDNGDRFAAGKTGYEYRPLSDADSVHRIIIQIEVEGCRIEGYLDTGAFYLILSPQIASEFVVDSADFIGDTDSASEGSFPKVKIRGVTCGGRLYRVRVALSPDVDGEGCDFEATAFVPEDCHEHLFSVPAYVGMYGCLERIRFAIDPTPEHELFYFGPIP